MQVQNIVQLTDEEEIPDDSPLVDLPPDPFTAAKPLPLACSLAPLRPMLRLPLFEAVRIKNPFH